MNMTIVQNKFIWECYHNIIIRLAPANYNPRIRKNPITMIVHSCVLGDSKDEFISDAFKYNMLFNDSIREVKAEYISKNDNVNIASDDLDEGEAETVLNL
jgi:hypothetical protein